jgi:hypothetical protein
MHIALGINPTVHHTGKVEQIAEHVSQCGQDDQHVDGRQQGVRSGCEFAERPTQALAHSPIMPQDPNSVETDMYKPKFSPLPSKRILGGLVIAGLLVSRTPAYADIDQVDPGKTISAGKSITGSGQNLPTLGATSIWNIGSLSAEYIDIDDTLLKLPSRNGRGQQLNLSGIFICPCSLCEWAG